MKKTLYIISAFFFTITGSIGVISKDAAIFADMRLSYLAIVIDDFGGYNRNGVAEMLSLDCPLTCAVMPSCENTFIDAESANKLGHEVILHMPMEAHTKLPEDWYGNIYIKNNDSPQIAREKLEKCLSLVPYAKGVNIHIGSGVSQNTSIMTEIMRCVKEKNMYFCDSKTTINSVCEQCARDCRTAFVSRNEFLEKTHSADYNYARQMLTKAAKTAKQKGYSVVIGHVGAEGGIATYEAIRDSLFEIKNMGIKIVPLSKIVSLQHSRGR